MEISNLIPHIEALVFASDKPLTAAEITDLVNQAFGFMEDKVIAEQVDAAIEGIVEKYNSEFYPFEVRQSGGGWQFLTKKDFHKTVAQLNGEKFLKRLSAAALETLSIIAYKQPVTKGEIESIRGVSSDYAVQKLLEKELIVISGRNEKMPGHPLIYATSKNFMDYFGINSAEDLPKIREILSAQVVEPTAVHPDNVEPSETFSVSDVGELIGVPPADGTEAEKEHAKEIVVDSHMNQNDTYRDKEPAAQTPIEMTHASYDRNTSVEENEETDATDDGEEERPPHDRGGDEISKPR